MPTKKDILDLYFMDARYKLIDIAAYLDRLDRHDGDADFRQEISCLPRSLSIRCLVRSRVGRCLLPPS